MAEPAAVADAFAKHFQSIHNNCSSIDFPRLSLSVSDVDVCKSIKRLNKLRGF
jgi:hypothetical protein